MYRKIIRSSWYKLILRGKKTYEGRLYRKEWEFMQIGDKIIFVAENGNIKGQTICVEIMKIKMYSNFIEAYNDLGCKLIPKIMAMNVKQVEQIYNNIYSIEETEKHEVIALKIKFL